MAFTGKLGTPDSYLGNILYGGASSTSQVFTPNISETLILSETAVGYKPPVGPQIYTRNVSEVITLAQTLAKGVTLNKRINEILVLVQVATGRRPIVYTLTISERIRFYESLTRTATRTRNLTETIILAELAKIRLPQIFDLAINETLIINQSATRCRTVNKNIAEVLVLVETTKRGASRKRDVSEILDFTERKGAIRSKERDVSESLALTETLTYKRVVIANITERLMLGETVIKSGVYTRTISERLPLVGGMVKTLKVGNLEFPVAEVEYVKVIKKCFVALEATATGNAIVLPCPEFGDSEKPMHSQVVKRSMTGKLYTYIRRNDLEQLTYQFVIGRKMALALQAYLDHNIAGIHTLTNWKGEIWKVYLTNNPFEFTGKELFGLEGERWEVTLEFQGVKVLG